MSTTAKFNYYQEFLDKFGGNLPDRRRYYGCPFSRDAMVKKYAWCVLTPAGFAEVAKYGPLLSLGSGKGYNEHMLRSLGADIIATDVNGHRHGPWIEVRGLDAVHAAAKWPERNLFISWPHYTAEWDAEAVAESQSDYVIYVGEGSGGCTGSEELHCMLFEDFEEVELPKDPPLLARWPGSYDYMAIYKRK